jgi:UDP-N-acetylglucosamine 2-epimerase (non-hydrolysing)
MHKPRAKVCTVFGTRPEVIKLAPVLRRLEAPGSPLQAVNVTSAQHEQLLYPFVHLFGLRIDHDLRVMEPGQTPGQVCARVLAGLDPVLAREAPDLVVVQGDTATAVAGALAGFYRRIPVAHVEAGLRSGDARSPFPEEMNRRLITRLACYHFAATAGNRRTLLEEGVAPERVWVTGNPVVDALAAVLGPAAPGPALRELLAATRGLRRLVLTVHRRENFGTRLTGVLRAVRDFVAARRDLCLVFPVHPNPAVRGPAAALLSGHPRIHLLDPLGYRDFIALLLQAWLILSDSGGVQEEAPTLGKPLLILRENTERPEVVECGVARLAGGGPGRLRRLLAEAYDDGAWVERARSAENPFGDGASGPRIVRAICDLLGVTSDFPGAVAAAPGLSA